MWTTYRNYTEIVDLKSGVQHLSEKFLDMFWEADDTLLIYGQEISEDELLKMERYRKAKELCDRFLVQHINIKQLYEGLKEISLIVNGFFKILKPYVSTDVISDDDDELEEDEGYDDDNDDEMEEDEGYDEED